MLAKEFASTPNFALGGYEAALALGQSAAEPCGRRNRHGCRHGDDDGMSLQDEHLHETCDQAEADQLERMG
ncbi:hypothetical protein CVV72_41080 (plasmid) [Amycolatopsis sp. TNS106]|nr:hypothetical protein CVV72_41080 [Amycolatopsis sp. TNS106]